MRNTYKIFTFTYMKHIVLITRVQSPGVFTLKRSTSNLLSFVDSQHPILMYLV
jgi:hypothetical protein